MAAHTPSISLGTVEQDYDGAPHFTDYWGTVYPQAVAALPPHPDRGVYELSPADLKSVRGLGSFMVETTKDLVGCDGAGPRIGPVNKRLSRLGFKNQGIDGTEEVIRRWDEGLGGLNVLHDAQPVFLKAAALLLKANEKGEVRWVDEWANGYQAFIHFWDKNSFNTPTKRHHVALGGELVHKAGWLESDPRRRRQLFRFAEQLYSSVRSTEPSSPLDWLLERRIHDLAFYDLDERIDHFRRKSRGQEWHSDDNLHTDAFNLMHTAAVALQKRQRQIMGSEEIGDLGFVAESMGVMALRDVIYTESGVSPNAFGVRFAFTSEDKPSVSVSPKTSFDVVLRKRNLFGNTQSVTPIQFKLDLSGERGGIRGSIHYMPPVTFVRLSLTHEDISAVADCLVQRYSGGAYEENLEPLAAVQTQLASRGVQAA